MKLNGNDYQHNFLEHNILKKGASLFYEMDTTPNDQRGIAPEDAPYSFTK